MSEHERRTEHGEDTAPPSPDQPTPRAPFTGGTLPQAEARSWKPFAVAGAVVLIVVGILVAVGHHPKQGSGRGGVDPYAASLTITGAQMSDSSNLTGGKETFLDGVITNRGSRTVTGVAVQVAFKDYSGRLAATDALPLTLIRMRQPYVDIEPVASDPIQPGQSRPFRLTFDTIPDSWDGAYPVVRVITVETR